LETLRRIRTMRGMNQVDLAKASGVAQNTISEIELGKREARPATLRKLARALDAEIADFFAEPESPKVPAPPSPEQPPLNGFEEERRIKWDAAVRSARQLREHAQGRTEELLALWRESKDRKEDAAERRAYLDEIGELLQQAYDARPTLFEAMSYERLPEQWPELGEADEFYRELWRLVQSAGLNIRTGKAQEERPKAVDEPEAA
jgi:transcriptional regulator with XRE-family HTH domain